MGEDTGDTGHALDEGRLIRLEALLGAKRLSVLLGVLRQRLERLARTAPALPDGAGAFQFLVHQSRGSAASLGLTGLAEGLDELEIGLHRNDPVATGDLDDRRWRACIVEQVRVAQDRFEMGSGLIEARIKT